MVKKKKYYSKGGDLEPKNIKPLRDTVNELIVNDLNPIVDKSKNSEKGLQLVYNILSDLRLDTELRDFNKLPSNAPGIDTFKTIYSKLKEDDKEEILKIIGTYKDKIDSLDSSDDKVYTKVRGIKNELYKHLMKEAAFKLSFTDIMKGTKAAYDLNKYSKENNMGFKYGGKIKYSKGGDLAQMLLPLAGTIGGAAIAGPLGMGIGGSAGQTLGSLVGLFDKKKQEPVEVIQPKPRFVSPSYASKGVDIRSFRNGGTLINPQYEVEKGEVIQGKPMLESGKKLSKNFVEVGGSKHSNGGTDGAGGERVYSDTIKVTPQTVDSISNMLGIKPSDYTAAKLQKKVARIINRNERLINKGDAISKTSAKRNLELANEATELIFKDQEMQKKPKIEFNTPEELDEYIKNNPSKQFDNPDQLEDFINNTPSELDNNSKGMFRKGGKLPKYGNGIDGLGEDEFGSLSNNWRNAKVEPLAPRTAQPFNVNSNAPLASPSTFSPVSSNGKTGGFDVNMLSDILPIVANVVNYASNQKDIKNIQTDTPVVQEDFQKLGYTDRSGRLLRSNRQAAQNLLGSLKRTGRDTTANLQRLYAQNLGADAQAIGQEDARRDQIGTTQAQLDAGTESRNVGRINQELQDRTANRLFKTRQSINNRNMLTQGISAQIQQSQLRQLDKDKMFMLLRQYESSGVGTAFVDYLADYNKQLAQKYITEVNKGN